MVEKAVVVISTGRQDLKLWAKGINEKTQQEKLFIVPIGGEIRAFHRRMREEGDQFYTICTEEEPARIAATRDGSLDYDGQKIVTIPEQDFKFRQETLIKPTAVNGPEPPYAIYPAKIARLVRELKRLIENHEISLHAILLFATERNTGDKYDQSEPIAAGDVLGRWLAQEFALQYQGEKEPDQPIQPDTVVWVNMLKGLKDFSGEGRDFPIHRQAARRIDEAIIRLAHGLNDGIALVSDTGGIAQLKPLIKASTRLHFRNKVVDLPDTETRPLKIDIQKSLEDIRITHCVESLEARNHCEQRLWQGDFIGAWGAVAHLQESEDDQNWLSFIRPVADFFLGVELKPAALFAEVAQVVNDWPAILRAAFKVEAALQGVHEGDRRIAEAILGTVNFYDLALRSRINQLLKELGYVAFEGDAMDGKLHLCEKLPAELRRDEKFFIGDKKGHLLSLGRGGDGYWLDWLCQRGEGAFKTYSDRLGQAEGRKALRTYRNYVAHRALSASDAQNAKQLALKLTLWQFPDTRPYDPVQLGQHFLATPHTVSVLRTFQLDDAVNRYRALVSRLVETVRAPLPGAG